MNLLDNALPHLNKLIASQAISLRVEKLGIVNGMPQVIEVIDYKLYAHIQPVTPFEVKKFTDSTIDSTKAYKFFFSNKDAEILHSMDKDLKSSLIHWNNQTYKIFSIRDWYLLNGWISAYGSLSEVAYV